MTKIKDAASRCRLWLSDSALPLWEDKGYCSISGVFEEGLLSRELPYQEGGIRFRVQPRQVYVFAHAKQLGIYHHHGVVDKAVSNGFDFFKNENGQFGFSVDQQLKLDDDSLNAYEHAFALLGYAWHYSETKNPDSLASAETCFQWFENCLSDPENGGYYSQYPKSSLRSQNPHMHLFEALMTLYEASDSQVWLKRAMKLHELFCAKFMEENYLREFFAEDFSATHADSENLDPGHHYEWVWLLSHYSKLTGEDVSDATKKLLDFAAKHGHSERGLVLDEIKDDGSRYRSTSRLWCQTEYLKAMVAMYEQYPSQERADSVCEVIDLIFDYYISPAEEGLWIDQVYEDGTAVSTKAPASTLYHIFLAFSELIRVAK